jgi:hypothetical protein
MFLSPLPFPSFSLLSLMLRQKFHEATPTMDSEASIPEPRNVFIYNEDTKDDIPDNVTHVKVDPSVKEIQKKAFIARWSLVEVEFSEGLEVIGQSAFEDCRNLK